MNRMTYNNGRRTAAGQVVVSDDVRITLNGTTAKISDMNPDDSIVFDFETNRGRYVISQITAHRKK